jgi:transposase, IS30 family
MAALDPVAERTISARFLSAVERLEIANRLRAGESVRAIAAVLGRSRSIISRGILATARRRRVPTVQGATGASAEAMSFAPAGVHANRPRDDLVATLLKERWSPQQISREVRAGYP